MKPSGIDWLGDIPAHWEMGNIRRYADMRTGHTPSRQNSEYWADCAIPWFTLADVWQLRSGVQVYLGETAERISEVGLANSAAELLPTGTVILSRTASIGYTGIMPKPMATSQDFWNWVCGPRLHPEYLLWQLRGMVHVFSMLTSGSTHKTIYRSDAASLRLVLPPRDEQAEIADFLDERTERIDGLIVRKERLLELLTEKRQALITRAVTKGLDPTVPMKPSGIEWLGDIPAHWDVAPLYSRYEVTLGKMLDEKRSTGMNSGRYLRNVDVQWAGINLKALPVMDFSPSERVKYRLRTGDLLVCEGGDVGRTAMFRDPNNKRDYFYQKALHRLRPRSNKDDPSFLMHAMFAASRSGIFVASGNPNTIGHLTAIQLRHQRFAFPSREEQYEISTSLEIAIGQLARAKELCELAIERLSELRMALITAAVTGQLDVTGEAA